MKRYFEVNFAGKTKQQIKHVSSLDMDEDFVEFEKYEEPEDQEMAEDENDEIKLDQIHQKTREIQERIDQEPQNAELWLELVSLQEMELVHSHAESRLQKQVAILEKAIEANPSSDRLSFEYIKAFSKLNDKSDEAVEMFLAFVK